MPKIFDCFTFFNENDVLDIRLQELSSVVDYFVIVESDITFRGNPKPSFFDEKRFSKYKDQIIRVWVADTPGFSSPWDREAWQRNAIARGLTSAEPDDIIVVSDVDEIPRRATLDGITPEAFDAIRLRVFSYGLNVLTPNAHTVKVRRYGYIDSDIQTIRKFAVTNCYEDGGWEFSSLSDAEGIYFKLRNFSHSEYDKPDIISVEKIRERMTNHEDILGFGTKFEIVEIDETWPEAVKNDPEYWSKYVW